MAGLVVHCLTRSAREHHSNAGRRAVRSGKIVVDVSLVPEKRDGVTMVLSEGCCPRGEERRESAVRSCTGGVSTNRPV